MDTGDFTLHKDEATGKAYIIFDRPHFEVICAELTDDYHEVTGEYSAHYTNMRPPYAREAPTIFEKDGRKSFKQQEKITVEYFDPETAEVVETEMYIDGYKLSLVKDTSYKGLWEVSFTLKEF